LTIDSAELRIKQYIISPELYQKGYRGGRSPCTCTSVCCQDGVYADVKERDRILEHREMIKKYMDETQTKDESLWFEPHEEEDSDFESRRCVGTQVVNGKCAFLDKFGRCSIQVAAAEEGMHRWALKPTFCILFPLEISNNVIRFDDLLDEEQSCCSIDAEFDVPMFRACKDELIHILGEDGYSKLETFYQERCRTLSSVQQQKEVV
jgi:hypothetical protein